MIKKNFKKYIGLIVAAGMLMGTVAGCQNGSSQDTPKEQTNSAAEEGNSDAGEGDSSADDDNQGNEGTAENGSGDAGGSISFPLSDEVTFSALAILDGESEVTDSLSMQVMEERTNVKWNVQSVMGSDLTEKKGLALSSGDYPEVFLKASFSRDELERYGKQGLLLPLNDLIREYAPNLCAVLDEMDAWDYITSSDGNIYSLPEISRPTPDISILFMNTRWLDNLGLEAPTNLDEFYEVLKAFKEQDANGNGDPDDEIPMTVTDVVKPELLLPYFGVTYNASTKTGIKDGEFFYVPTSEIYKEFVAYIEKLYSEGLIDKNGFTNKHEQQAALGMSGDVLGFFFDAGSFLTVGRERDADFDVLDAFDEGVFPVGSGIFPGTLVVTDACENPEVAVAWADYLYTEEGGILAWLGTEGVTYESHDDGTWDWIVENGYGDDIGSVRSLALLQGAANHPSIQPDYWFDGITDVNERLLNEQRSRVAERGAKPYPVLMYSDSDTATIASIKADVDNYIDQYLAQVATGELSLEDSWDDYIATMEAMGAGELAQIYTTAYEEAVK